MDPLKPQYYISAYGEAVQEGFQGSRKEWLESLKVKGDPGKSAYEYAVAGGFKGSEEDFEIKLASEGKSAYEYAKEYGYKGTEEDFGIKMATQEVWKILGRAGVVLIPNEKGEITIKPADIDALSIEGGTMKGLLKVLDPQTERDAVPKSYADKKLPKTGGQLTGGLDMTGNAVNNVADPTGPADAANKKTVDDRILTFHDLTIQPGSWSENPEKKIYRWEAAVNCPGVTADHVPQVTWSDEDADTGNFGPTARTESEAVIVSADSKPEAPVTIPTIQAAR